MLAGLARDGGLYVPKTWPQADAGDHRLLRRQALRRCRRRGDRAVRRRRDPARRAAAAWRARAYARFGHPAVTPLVQIGSNLWILELFHGPTLAFKDVAMQLLARLMDRVLSARGERATIVGATSGDTGGAAIEAFRGSQRVDVVILFPRRPRLRRAAAHDDDAARGQRARRRDRRHVRRLPGAGEGHVQRPGLSRPHQAGRRQLDQLGAHRRRRSATTSPPRPRSAPRIGRCRSSCRPATSATSSPATSPSAWACRSSSWSSPPTSTTSCRARCHRHLRGARRHRHHLAVDGHPGLLQLRALPVRGLRAATRPGCAPRCAPCAQRAASISAPRCEPMRARLRRRPRQRSRGRRLHPARQAAQRLPARSAHAPAASSRPRRLGTQRARRTSCSPPPIPAKFPDAMQAITGERPALPPRLAGLMTRPGALHHHAQRSGGRRALRRSLAARSHGAAA